MTNLPPPATVFTFFLALPYAIPIPDKTVQGFVEARTPLWDEWSPDDLGAMVGSPTPFGDDTIPGTRMAVRHRELNVPVPPVAAFEAFADWIEAPLPTEVFEYLSQDTAKWKASGMDIVVSIVALSRFLPRSAHPTSDEISVAWFHNLLRPALTDLSEFLESVGLSAQRWDIGALAPRSLPAMVPVLVESSYPDTKGNRQGATTIVPLHDAVLIAPSVFHPSVELLGRASELSNAANRGLQPYMLAFRLIHGAEAERLAGDPTRAVIDLNTAIEVLISVTLSEAGRRSGWDEQKIAKAIGWRTGLKRRVSEYLSELVGEPIDVGGNSGPWGRWFTGGYRLRNAAVHEGRRLLKADVDGALEQAKDVVIDLRSRLAGRENFEELSRMLAIEFGGNPAWESELLKIRFPWEL